MELIQPQSHQRLLWGICSCSRVLGGRSELEVSTLPFPAWWSPWSAEKSCLGVIHRVRISWDGGPAGIIESWSCLDTPTIHPVPGSLSQDFLGFCQTCAINNSLGNLFQHPATHWRKNILQTNDHDQPLLEVMVFERKAQPSDSCVSVLTTGQQIKFQRKQGKKCQLSFEGWTRLY